ncbi:prepilin-type N-terminal cleavage/methylation domain-containing protein [Pseudomonas sp. RHF3.3-3]|uniref:prepilin-type N-terminal cleavage/methylation domain-containing protein n=1 Tax=Pseudomonas sp. RHF3.3-3 TaxID=3396624 RepID=UPI003A8C76DA
MTARQHGFTLLEVLIALGLLGLLMLLIASTLTASSRTQELGERYSSRLDEIRSAQDFLRSSAQQAYPTAFRRDDTNNGTVFEGEHEQLSLVAPLPTRLAGGLPLQVFSLIQDRNGSKNLQVAFFQFDDRGLHPWAEPQVLLHDLEHWQLSYRGLDNALHPTDWLPRWPWPERLPLALRIELQPDGPISWPPLEIALRLSDTQASP